ncbi:unnamed protein product [Lactuca virosa]|uniref:Uncharacterized protein n=1 Tax=Lactuca virosa TaxID=75947 RepID=A0AAU9PQX2_9ASTR|nr:unnamed protein product [Lactuca virosa]
MYKASGETQDNIVLEDPLKTQHHDALHPDPDEELLDELLFNNDSASIAARPLFSSFNLPTKPSSSSLVYDFGLSSSSSKLVDEEIKIDDQAQIYLGDET